jgi:NAD(P)-dependent dehydrogenase (short-subunit alcohol dehydrogenase family)
VELAGRHGILVAGVSGIGRALADELERAGAAVTVVDPTNEVSAMAAAFDAVASAAVAVGGPTPFVVLAHLDPAAAIVRPLVEVDDEAWAAACEASIEVALATVQAAHRVVHPEGRMVFVLPSISMVGAADLVPLCAAVESQRVLAKTAARRWASQATTVNVLAVELAAFFGGAMPVATPTLNGPVLGDRDAAADAFVALRYILDPASGGLTGATLGLDGGTVMAP